MKKIYPCVVGLGYVGLPLFISLKKKFKVVGFDINKKRVNDLRQLNDRNKEFKKKDLRLVNNSSLTYNKIDIKNSNFYIITVPTPIKKNNIPDLKYVKSAFKIIANYITNNDIIFLESTVYPGTTLKICRNIIKNKKKNINFYIGYSSERINPGDKIHNIKNIAKVVSINANKKINDIVKKVYCNVSKKIIFTKKINEAELSKLIENTQRDLNIGLMNELMILCEKSNLDFNEVLRLANTKWNFLRFKPGLVGGHCLPVDPYYLSYYAKNLKYNTKITLAARYTNNYMEKFIFKKIYSNLLQHKKKKIVILGLTYKSNVPDYRNSLAINIFNRLKKKNRKIKAYDPIIDNSFNKKNSVSLKEAMKSEIFVLLVKHQPFNKIIKILKKQKKIIIDPLSLI
jgi:UDP-N-acetyl-D-galactosamine dehydrogenase